MRKKFEKSVAIFDLMCYNILCFGVYCQTFGISGKEALLYERGYPSGL